MSEHIEIAYKREVLNYIRKNFIFEGTPESIAEKQSEVANFFYFLFQKFSGKLYD